MKIWKRKDRDVWVIDYRDRTGKRVRMVGGPTQEAAYLKFSQRQLDEATAPVVPVKDADITVADYADQWLATVKGKKAQRTYRSYSQLVTGHILPTLGPMKLREVRHLHVLQLLEAKRLKMGKNTVRLIKSALSTMFRRAVKHEIVSVNPALGDFSEELDEGADGSRDPTVNAMSRAQLAQFTDTMEAMHQDGRLPLRFQVYFAILSGTGMRPGEVLALQVGDLRVSQRRIRVERALNLDGSDKPTKTKTTRMVDCSETLTASLTDYVTWLTVEALAHGQEPLRLFPGLTHQQVRSALARILTTAGLPHFSPYDFRHTYASLLLSANVPLLYVSARMGHRKPTMTLKYYATYMPDGEQNFSHLLLGTKLAPGPKMLQYPKEMCQKELMAYQV